jgi:hypothetical protein
MTSEKGKETGVGGTGDRGRKKREGEEKRYQGQGAREKG